MLIGAVLHLGLQIPSLLRLKGSYMPTLGLKLAPAQEVARLMGPRLLGVAVVQLNFWVNTRLASYQPEGSVVAIQIAFALMLMPQIAIAQSVATAVMPTLSAQFARGEMKELRTTLAASLRGMLLLAIPASLGLILLRQPLIELLFQRGEFTPRSTELVSWALLWYAAGLVGHCVMEVLARAFLRPARYEDPGGDRRGRHEPECPVQPALFQRGSPNGAGRRTAGWRWQTRWLPPWK